MKWVNEIWLEATRYAQRSCRKICKKSVEHMEMLSKEGKVLAKNRGTSTSVNLISNKNAVIATHNHPLIEVKGIILDNAPLNSQDLFGALNHNLKKIYASTPVGYTTMDFSNMNISLRKAKKILKEGDVSQQKVWQQLVSQAKSGIISIQEVMTKCTDEATRFNKEFAKKYKCTYSEIKWDDFKSLKSGKNNPFQ